MVIEDDDIKQIRTRFESFAWALDERMRRLFAAAETAVLGHGGITRVAQATGVSRRAIHAGLEELASEKMPVESQEQADCKAGAGRKSVIETDSGVMLALEKLVEPTTRGDPESPWRWTCKSLRTLADELSANGHSVSYPKVGDLLRELGYSLQANRKMLEGTDHPEPERPI